MADNALNMDMGSYTQHKYQDMINEAAEDYDSKDDFTALLEKINSDDFFEPFSARLLRYLSKHEGIDFSPEKAARFLRGKLEVAEANLSRNTVNNWLNVSGSSTGSTGPRLGDEGREAMFQVAFALGLTTAEAEDYFHRVFLDKAFNARNVKEFVYFYCIQHGKLYSQAQSLASEAGKIISSGRDSASMADTKLIQNAGNTAGDDAELLTFIAEHAFSFTSKNETALSIQNWLLSELRGTEERQGLAEKEYLSYGVNKRKGSEGRNMHSVDFVLDLASKGVELKKTKGIPGVKRAREVFARKEISNQFPNANTISHPDSSYILRKNIIFLFFYWFWVKWSLEEQPDWDDETFQDEMNNILERCGFGPLYYGNPYDWLFLYCSNCVQNDSNPIDVFRAILMESSET